MFPGCPCVRLWVRPCVRLCVFPYVTNVKVFQIFIISEPFELCLSFLVYSFLGGYWCHLVLWGHSVQFQTTGGLGLVEAYTVTIGDCFASSFNTGLSLACEVLLCQFA